MKPVRRKTTTRAQDVPQEHREHSIALLIAMIMFFVFVVVGVIFFVKSLGSEYKNNTDLKFESSQTKNEFLFPTAKDTLVKGQVYTIRWSGGPQTIQQLDLVNRAYEKEGVSVSLVDRFYNLENTGSYEVTIPTEIPVGQYKFQMGPMSSQYFEVKEKN